MPKPDETPILNGAQQECQRGGANSTLQTPEENGQSCRTSLALCYSRGSAGRRWRVQGAESFGVFPKISTTVENTVEKRQSRLDPVVFPRFFCVLEHIHTISRARTATIPGAFRVRP